jgi:Flp pilus assembly secretin CpaC
MLGAAPAVLEELRADLVTPPEGKTLQVSAFRVESNLEERLNRLSAKRLLEVLSASRLVARANREVSVQAGAEWPSREGAPAGSACGLRIQLSPAVSRRGTIRLRLEPELRSLAVDGVSSRRTETEIELADRQSCLVTGLLDSGSTGALLDRLFPGRSRPEANKDFLVVVTPRLATGVETAAMRTPR